MAVIEFLEPFFIGIEFFPLHANPMQIEIDLKEKATYPAVGIIKRVDLDKMLIKFDGLIHGHLCSGDEMGYRTLHLSLNASWWSALKLLARSKENKAIIRVLTLAIGSCVGKDVLKEVVMENTGELDKESLVFL